MKTSIFDLFKIGIGPSSSHTMGPMRAALRFVSDLAETGKLTSVWRVATELYGSLALTGVGHGTDRAVLLGLSGEKPEEVDPASVASLIGGIRDGKTLRLLRAHPIEFIEDRDLLFHKDVILPGHPNALRFTAFGPEGVPLLSNVFYSVGGGFVVKQGEERTEQSAG